MTPIDWYYLRRGILSKRQAATNMSRSYAIGTAVLAMSSFSKGNQSNQILNDYFKTYTDQFKDHKDVGYSETRTPEEKEAIMQKCKEVFDNPDLVYTPIDMEDALNMIQNKA